MPGPTTERLAKLAKELAIVLVVPLYERQAAGLYRNSAVVIDADGALLGTYRKMHIPHDPLFEEKYYFAPGDATQQRQPAGARGPAAESGGFMVWKTRYATIGVLICWDQWYPEGARITSLLGADILFYPTAIGWHPAEKAEFGAAQVDAWRTAQRAHAIANGVFVASPNRAGFEPEAGHRRTRVLRALLHLRSVRALPRAGRDRRRDAHRDVRSGADRDDASQLALPARPSRRRLRPDPRALARVVSPGADATPAADAGKVRWPAEWEKHDATWIAWPHHEPDWPGKFEPIRWVYAEIVRALAPHETVQILCHDEKTEEQAWHCLQMHEVKKTRYHLHRCPTDRVWMRDSGPTGVQLADGSVRLVHWDFNAWAKYENFAHDKKVGAAVAAITGLARHEPMRPDGNGRVVLEGRRHRDRRRGTMLVTEEWLLSKVQVRNPGLTRADYEKVFARSSGSRRRSGSAKDASATTRTGMWTTSRGSSRRGSSCSRTRRIRRMRITGDRRITSTGSARRPTPPGTRSRSSPCPTPGR